MPDQPSPAPDNCRGKVEIFFSLFLLSRCCIVLYCIVQAILFEKGKTKFGGGGGLLGGGVFFFKKKLI